MIHFMEKFKIPTILGTGIILVGIIAGLFLVLKDLNLLSRASPDITPQDVTFTNITDTTIVVSWKTANPASSFITFGQNSPSEQTALDDRDQASPSSHTIHYVSLKKLRPSTQYQMKIVTSRISSDIFKFKTASSVSSQNNFGPIIGSVLQGNKPLTEGIAYLSVADANIQSSLIKNLGSFLIPLTQLRKADLSGVFNLSDKLTAKLTIVGSNNQSTVLFKLRKEGVTLPVVKLGQNLDLTIPQVEAKEPTPSILDLRIFDLNEDGQINAADNAIVLRNFGKNPKERKADFNSDGIVDQKDLDAIAEKVNEPISQ